MGDQDKETIVSDEEETIEKIEPEDIEVEHSDNNENDHAEELAELRKELESLREEKEAALERSLRLQAEYENFKKRTEKEKSAAQKYKSQDLANELLPALDNFERALKVEVNDDNRNLIEGITMVYSQLEEALKAQGIEKMETLNEQFDPNLHHAVMQVEDEEKDSNTIVEELQAGYMLKDRVIRPAMVKVNK
ncbi:nucleotide exchange factor GrpE [Virgibacillus sp. W0181]|uniref:nucleotide exchange factor GrpE n=1 Tax=Virgibacillus sp. W0181 TaxID=3391581 RepID=UPI003F458788